MAEIHTEVLIQAPIQAVWDRYMDHANATEWLPMKSSELTRPGAEDPNGLGAIRTFKRGGLALVEEVVTADAPTYMEYRLIGGVPFLKHHLGRARLTDTGQGVRLVWDITLEFKPLTPAWLLTRIIIADLQKRFQAGLEKMKVLVERDAA